MWWLEKTNRLTRLLAVLALGGLTAGCFQSLYGEHTVAGGVGGALQSKLAAVDVAPIVAPNGTALARISVKVRNDLIFDLTGGSGTASATHRLTIILSTSQKQVIVDYSSGRVDIQNYGIDATYSLVDLATKQAVVNGQTFSRVAYNIPGQEQRFAGARGLRDAENRAAKVIADNIRTRLASYFVAGS